MPLFCSRNYPVAQKVLEGLYENLQRYMKLDLQPKYQSERDTKLGVKTERYNLRSRRPVNYKV